jgi:putative membrane-bound dehydrogenase-like protein
MVSHTALALSCLVIGNAAAWAENLVPVGVASVDITPHFPVRLSGYGARRTESDGVAQPIWAKSLAIGESPSAVVLITVDNLGISDEISAEVARRLVEKYGLSRERLAICASHTHCAPMLTHVAPTLFGMPIPPEHQRHIDQYTVELTDKLERVAAVALADRKPARLSWSKGKVTFAANRRTAGGPVDHDLPVLKVEDPNGAIRAIFVNYACHCTTLEGNFNRVHGDWCGAAQELIQRSHPGAVALVAIGCGADSNPFPRSSPNLATQHGESIALEVNRLLAGPWVPLPGGIDVRFERVELDFDTLPTKAQWESLAKQPGAIGYHARVQLQKLAAGQQIQSKLSYPIQTWCFGDRLAMVFLAGEVVVDYSLRLKREYDPSRLWVNAYSNDAPCYIPSLRILREGGYEGGGAMIYYDRPTRFASNVEQRIFDGLHHLIPATFKAPKDPLEYPPPKTPKDSLASLKLKPGYRAELVASEPKIASPVAIDWGADCRLWVVEMYDYPSGIDGNYKPGGRVKYLESTKGDGVYDKVTVLADDLPFPTGLMAWHGGVLVCAAPDILYLEDTKRDGKCDVRRVLFTGFSTTNYQARVNGLTHGLDGWVYGANGLLGGRIINKIGPPRVVEIGGRDFRMKPDTGEFEAVSGLTQQGRTCDDWGHWFGGDNSNLLRHFPLPDHYLSRNPNFAAPLSFVNVPSGDADPNRLFPASRILQRFNDFGSAGRTTSACSPLIYRDDLLGEGFRGNSFTCEPVHDLVTRRVLTPTGSTFTGKRAADEQSSEFFASTDNWCRPVQVRTGPDGALWIVDMYRFVIEHPRWIPPERLAELDVRAGADMGRIYRVLPENVQPRRVPRVDRMTTAELVNELDSPNGPIRDLAQRRLLDLRDPSAVPLLVEKARLGSVFGRLHALCTLGVLGKLEPSQIQLALADSNSGIRRHAVRLSEPLLTSSAELQKALMGLANDPDADVRFQLVCSLGYCSNPEVGNVLARLAVRDANDPYVIAGALSSINRENIAKVVENLIADRSGAAGVSNFLNRVLSVAPALADSPQLIKLLESILATPGATFQPWQLNAASALLDAMESRGVRLTASAELAASFERLLRQARSQASAQGSEGERTAALRLFGRVTNDLKKDIQVLGRLISPQEPPAIQFAAIDRLAQIRDPAALPALLADWGSRSPAARTKVLDVLISRQEGIPILLEAVEKHQVRANDIDAARRQILLAYRDEHVRRRAAAALQATIDPDRNKVVEKYRSLVKSTGNISTGATVFGKTCAACHRVNGIGHATGPDLAALTDRSTDFLLISILDPSRVLDGRYSNFTALTKRGLQYSGMLLAESAASVTLVGPDGKQQEISRSDLEELTNTGKSLMPDGLEKEVSPEAMADLMAFLRSLGRPPKIVAGNRPTTAKPGAEGLIRLRASECEIRGNEITFESDFHNLGMWHGEGDTASWTVEVPKDQRYRVDIIYACDNASAGNTMVIEAGDAKLTTRVAGTGRWSDYVTVKIGELDLKAGSQRVTARPGAALRGALLDLTEVRLVPVK